MALINCPECKRQKISDKAGTICPKCGYVHTQENINKEVEELKNMPIWKQYFYATLGFIIVVLGTLFFVGITASEEVRYLFSILLVFLAYKSWNLMNYSNIGAKKYFVSLLVIYSAFLAFSN